MFTYLDLQDGFTALIVASQNGHFEVVRKLVVEAKADINIKTNASQTLGVWGVCDAVLTGLSMIVE